MPGIFKSQCLVCGKEADFRLITRRGDGKDVVRCLLCGCGILRDAFVMKDTSAFYQQSYFTEENPSYMKNAESMACDSGSLGNQVLDRLATRLTLEGTRLLDVGCGGGELLLAARRRGAEVTGIDISGFAAEQGRKFGLDVRHGTLPAADFAKESFDVIYMMDMIEHSLTPRAEIQAASQILKQKGWLCILTPNLRSYRIWGSRWHGFNASYEHVLFLNLQNIRTLLEPFGFRIMYSETLGMVDIIDYYFPVLAGVLPRRVGSLMTRVISNKILRKIGAEHRLFVMARKSET